MSGLKPRSRCTGSETLGVEPSDWSNCSLLGDSDPQLMSENHCSKQGAPRSLRSGIPHAISRKPLSSLLFWRLPGVDSVRTSVPWTDGGFRGAESGARVLLWQVNCHVTVFCADQPRGTACPSSGRAHGSCPPPRGTGRTQLPSPLFLFPTQ